MKKILIADDELAIRLLLKDTFEAEGYETCTACDGREAIEILEKCLRENCPIDLIILDIRMEEMGGREALRVIKYRLCLDTPVIFYTAYDFKQNFDFWEAADYLVKSADLGELVDKVKELLRD